MRTIHQHTKPPLWAHVNTQKGKALGTHTAVHLHLKDKDRTFQDSEVQILDRKHIWFQEGGHLCESRTADSDTASQNAPCQIHTCDPVTSPLTSRYFISLCDYIPVASGDFLNRVCRVCFITNVAGADVLDRVCVRVRVHCLVALPTNDIATQLKFIYNIFIYLTFNWE